MNPKKKSRRCRGLGLNSGLDLAISRFIYSFVCNPLLFTFRNSVQNTLHGNSFFELEAVEVEDINRDKTLDSVF